MNDFTKEELITLAESLPYIFHKEPGYMTALLQKIDSMINNYCEHDGARGIDYPAEKCMECGHAWDGDYE